MFYKPKPVKAKLVNAIKVGDEFVVEQLDENKQPTGTVHRMSETEFNDRFTKVVKRERKPKEPTASAAQTPAHNGGQPPKKK